MSWTNTRARLATEFRIANAEGRPPDSGRVAELRTRLKAERLEEHLRTTLASGPPLTSEQLGWLANVLADAARGRPPVPAGGGASEAP